MAEVTKLLFAVVLATLLPLILYFQSQIAAEGGVWIYVRALGLALACSYAVIRVAPSWNLAGYSVVIPVKKAVLITGCDSGLGHALAKKLDTFMFSTVFAACLHPDGEGAKKLVAECSKRVVIVPLDVSSDDSVADAMKTIDEILVNRNHNLWAVVNNAGIWACADIEFAPVERFKRLAEVNVYGTVRVTKACLHHIRRNKGRIVNVSSISGLWTLPANAEYCMTKYAIESFTDTLRHEMHQWGVKVSAVEPGPYARATRIGLNMWEDFVKSSDELWDATDERIKRQYGREYFDSHIEWWRRALEGNYGDATPVVDAMVHAVWSVNPRRRYLVGGFFNTRMKALLSAVLPSYLADSFFAKHLTSYSKPASLRKST